MATRVLLVMGLAVCVALALGGCGSANAAAGSDAQKVSAIAAAQGLIEHTLKSPGSAQHEAGDLAHVEYLGDDRYRYSAWVDSQNGYGALLRTKYTMTVEEKEGHWGYVDVIIH